MLCQQKKKLFRVIVKQMFSFNIHIKNEQTKPQTKILIDSTQSVLFFTAD